MEKRGYLCGMKKVVEISGFSSGKRVAAGMFDGLKEGVRLFGRLLGVGVIGRQVGFGGKSSGAMQCFLK